MAAPLIIGRDFFLPLAIIGGLILLVLTIGTHVAIGAIDRASEERERVLAQNGIVQRMSEVAQMVVPQADWDDAVRNLDNRFNRAWAHANIGKYLNQTNGFAYSFVLDSDDQPIFASTAGAEAATDSFKPLSRLTATLLSLVRQQERHRGRLPAGRSVNMISKPIQASALKLVDGQAFIATATLVQPDFGTAGMSGARAPIIVTLMPIDRAFLGLFARRYLFEGLHIRLPGDIKPAGAASMPLRDDRGRTLALLTWHSADPGYAMLRRYMLPVAALFLVMIIVALVQLRRMQRFADSLIASDAASRHIAWHDPLTGLPNEAFFHHQLSSKLREADARQQLAIQVIQIDRYQRLRDRLGPERGDELLRAFSLRLHELGDGAGFVATLGGGMFAVLVRRTDEHASQCLSATLRDALMKPLLANGKPYILHCWLAYALVPPDCDQEHEAMRLAEVALRSARRRDGRADDAADEVEGGVTASRTYQASR